VHGKDQLGNWGGTDSSTFVKDTAGPTLTIDKAVGQADPTSTAPIKFAVVFNEPVSDFTNADVDLSSSTAGGTLVANVYNYSLDGKTYEVKVNGMTTAGDVVINIGVNKATDAAGNGNQAPTIIDNRVAWQPTAGNTTPVVTIISPTFGSVYAKGSAAINPLTVKASFTDPDNGPWTYTINWDDGSTNATGSATPAPSTFQATHSYTNPGVYTINVCVKDGLMASGCAQVWIVVYDPNGGFVTGGGWINVAKTSYTANPDLEGRANFGFNSQYKKNANIPTGETEFNFQVGNMNFHSTAYNWLIVSGYKAQYKGTGTINGGGKYSFTLTAYDGDITGGGGGDKFRIRITDDNNANAVVFDNRIGANAGPDNLDTADPQAISGGSIVIHKA
jgi:PKD domain/Bacterial Ig-like domain